MKLNFFFILTDLVTLAAYPIMFVLGKLRQLGRFIESKTLASSTAINTETLNR
jgi:hypothetical protein